MAILLRLVCFGASVILCACSADTNERTEGQLRIATWNLSNLYHRAGQSIPGRRVVRDEGDYAKLRGYAWRLDADIVAFQEVNSPAAIQRIFPQERWKIFISGRRTGDLEACRTERYCETDGIYTGFVIRKSIDARKAADVKALSVDHMDGEGRARPTRWGVEIEVRHAGHVFRMLSVHLKSRCTAGALRGRGTAPFVHPSNPHCTTLAKQIAPLDAWIDAQERAGIPFIVLGDFNRSFDVHGERDHLWAGIDDGEPVGARLTRFPSGRVSPCWRDAPPARHHPEPIDFILFGAHAARWAEPASLDWLVYEKADAKRVRQISDHCPVYIDLRFTR